MSTASEVIDRIGCSTCQAAVGDFCVSKNPSSAAALRMSGGLTVHPARTFDYCVTTGEELPYYLKNASDGTPRPLNRQDVLNDVSCPKCGARVGSRCFGATQNGVRPRRKAMHQERWDSARAKMREEGTPDQQFSEWVRTSA